MMPGRAACDEQFNGFSSHRQPLTLTKRRAGQSLAARPARRTYSPSFDATHPVLAHSRSRSRRNDSRDCVMSVAHWRSTR